MTEQWSRPDRDIKVLEIRELSGQDAVQVKAIDRPTDRLVTTTYYFGDEGGEWPGMLSVLVTICEEYLIFHRWKVGTKLGEHHTGMLQCMCKIG